MDSDFGAAGNGVVRNSVNGGVRAAAAVSAGGRRRDGVVRNSVSGGLRVAAAVSAIGRRRCGSEDGDLRRESVGGVVVSEDG